MKKVELEQKMKNYGKNVLSQKDAAGAKRKKRRQAQNLRRAIRAQREEKVAQIDAMIEEELEKQKVLDEYLGGEQDG